jgi:hypothetical protein
MAPAVADGLLRFGIASFEPTASVNSSVDWLLYDLVAVSFLSGFRGDVRKPKARGWNRQPQAPIAALTSW